MSPTPLCSLLSCLQIWSSCIFWPSPSIFAVGRKWQNSAVTQDKQKTRRLHTSRAVLVTYFHILSFALFDAHPFSAATFCEEMHLEIKYLRKINDPWKGLSKISFWQEEMLRESLWPIEARGGRGGNSAMYVCTPASFCSHLVDVKKTLNITTFCFFSPVQTSTRVEAVSWFRGCVAL